MDQGEPQPSLAASPAEFVAALERLKARSGLTYRELEERSAARGEFLRRSTIADALRRPTLPRPEFVAAFVRACGAESDVEEWLAALARLGAPTSGAVVDPPSGDAVVESGDAVVEPSHDRAPEPSVRRRSLVVLSAAVAVTVAVVVALWPHADPDRPALDTTPTPTGQQAPSLSGWARIHPGRAPDLCVTEGHDSTGRYHSEVAVQRPCTDAEPPRTLLERVHDDLYQVKWDHPDHGIGCLTVIVGGVGANLVEPWSDCRGERPIQLFRVEPTTSDRYRLRPAETQLCLGVRDDTETSGAEIVQETCTGAADQEFVIESREGR
ncbi:MAG: XRE family transcriptional regulator [Saccharothrix sp.]|nr:XRE family transcriptional regulator [Saccharothrix sp.]